MKNKNTHVSAKKKQIVKDLANLLTKKTILVCSIKNLKSAQFQDIKKKLRLNGEIKVAKKSLIDFALEHSKEENLKSLLPHINSDYALIFSNEDAFSLSALLSANKSPAKAREGQIANEEIWVKAGPTSLVPGPDISALSSLGLQPKVEGGKIAIMKDNLLIKKGEKISAQKASILAKLDITPFEIGLDPLVALSEGKLYTEVKIDKKRTLMDLIEAYSKSLAFAISLDILNKETLPFLLKKALCNEKAISCLIQTPTEKEGEVQ